MIMNDIFGDNNFLGFALNPNDVADFCDYDVLCSECEYYDECTSAIDIPEKDAELSEELYEKDRSQKIKRIKKRYLKSKANYKLAYIKLNRGRKKKDRLPKRKHLKDKSQTTWKYVYRPDIPISTQRRLDKANSLFEEFC